MPFTATVTKVSVQKTDVDSYSVTVRVVSNDGATDVLDQQFSVRYNSNALNMADIKSDLTNQIKEAWDKYTEETDIFNAPAFDTLVSDLQTQANTYFNL